MHASLGPSPARCWRWRVGSLGSTAPSIRCSARSYQLPVFAAAIFGGLGSPIGAVVGALVIGLVEELSTLIFSTNYRQIVSFAIILLLPLFRTQGLFGGKAVRK